MYIICVRYVNFMRKHITVSNAVSPDDGNSVNKLYNCISNNGL